MASTVEEVGRLRDSAYFSETTIPLLEKLVAEEAAQESVYNAKANRGLLKLYGFFPARINADVITLILVKVGGGKALQASPPLL